MCALIITARRHDWRLTMEPGQKQGRTCLCYTYENRAAGGCSFTQVALTRCLLLVIYDILHILAFTGRWNVILLVLIKLEIFRIAHQCLWDSGAPYCTPILNRMIYGILVHKYVFKCWYFVLDVCCPGFRWEAAAVQGHLTLSLNTYLQMPLQAKGMCVANTNLTPSILVEICLSCAFLTHTADKYGEKYVYIGRKRERFYRHLYKPGMESKHPNININKLRVISLCM